MKYYNAEKLLEFVKQNTPNIDGETTMECVERAIKEAPTADVVEVKHGEWIPHKIMLRAIYARNYDCSECGNSPIECGDYCNKCGARMDGRRDT